MDILLEAVKDAVSIDTSREDRFSIVESCLILETDAYFEQAEHWYRLFRKLKSIAEEGLKESEKGQLSVSLKRNSNGSGFEFSWILLERYYRARYGRKPFIKRFKKGMKDRYSLYSIQYPRLQEWEVEIFELIEDRVAPLRTATKDSGKLLRSHRLYVNKWL